jgi:hypothetical protein
MLQWNHRLVAIVALAVALAAALGQGEVWLHLGW